MHVSFIIPHKGRFEMLIQTIESIAAQDYDLEKLEVMVISQTPQIQQQALLSECKLKLTVLIENERHTISALRNIGVKHAAGQYLAFLDADVAISNNWVNAMLALMTDNAHNRAITSAVQICGDNPPPLESIRTHLSNAEVDTNVAFLPGRNLFISRQTFEQVGGFPEHLITCEDYYFTDQAAKFGELFYSSTATYVHIGEDKVFKDMFKKEIWRGQSNLQSLEGRTVPLREIPSLVVPLAMASLLLLAITLFALQLNILATSALGLTLLPVLAYSMRLYRLAHKDVSLFNIMKFYTIYFPARAIGTVAGLFKSIQTKSH
jgi:glycosyltransferase involved in cell wall biosynthesis